MWLFTSLVIFCVYLAVFGVSGWLAGLLAHGVSGGIARKRGCHRCSV